MAWRILLRSAAPIGASIGAYCMLADEPRRPFVRVAKALATGFADKKTFDEHFPRSEWDDNWDFRSPAYLVCQKNADKDSLEEQKSTAVRNIILIRHGQYNMDSQDKFLTELGREQARRMGKRLAQSGLKLDHILMSTMNRATETANLILEELPKDLKRSSSSLIEEGPPYPPVPPNATWRPSYAEFFTESARIESAFRRFIHRAPPSQKEDSYEVIVCHANVIRYFVCRALQFPPEGWLRMSLGNGSLTWLVIRPNGRVSLKALGDVGHLPAELVTYT